MILLYAILALVFVPASSLIRLLVLVIVIREVAHIVYGYNACWSIPYPAEVQYSVEWMVFYDEMSDCISTSALSIHGSIEYNTVEL